jgi:anti-sigma regulatory factor (Ser/Thr protein kinase)
LTEVLAATGCLGFRQDGELLISELATNAVIYGGGVIDVVVRASADGIWVGVTDSGKPYVWTQWLDSCGRGWTRLVAGRSHGHLLGDRASGIR